MLEFLFRNFQLLVCCGLLHQLSVTEISDPFCHSAYVKTRAMQKEKSDTQHLKIKKRPNI
jgi:hypothetical protein